MGKLKPIDVHQLIYPSPKELTGVILDRHFLDELLKFKTRSAIPGGSCFHLCWIMKGLLKELTHRHPDLTYVSVYFDNENSEDFIYEGDLDSALEIIICFKPSFSSFQS